jgi:hypothetical protein
MSTATGRKRRWADHEPDQALSQALIALCGDAGDRTVEASSLGRLPLTLLNRPRETQRAVSIVGDILTAASKASELSNRAVQARRERRDRAAAHFDGIAATVEEVVDILRSDGFPAAACERLHQQAVGLPAATEDVIGHTDAHDLADLLDRAHGVRQLAYELDDNADRARELIRLERAAGMLRGVADNLRAAA